MLYSYCWHVPRQNMKSYLFFLFIVWRIVTTAQIMIVSAIPSTRPLSISHLPVVNTEERKLAAYTEPTDTPVGCSTTGMCLWCRLWILYNPWNPRALRPSTLLLLWSWLLSLQWSLRMHNLQPWILPTNRFLKCGAMRTLDNLQPGGTFHRWKCYIFWIVCQLYFWTIPRCSDTPGKSL